MAGRDLKLQVVFAALDKITGPLKKIVTGSSETAKALKATSDRLRDLNAQQKTSANSANCMAAWTPPAPNWKRRNRRWPAWPPR